MLNTNPRGWTTPSMPEIHYCILGEIKAPEEYTDLWDLMTSAPEGSIIHIHFNSPGGHLNTALQFKNLAQTTRATIIGYGEGLVGSAATIMLLSCHGLSLGEYSYYLFHDGSTGMGFGKLNESKIYMDFMSSFCGKLYHDVYSLAFSEDEVDEILKGQDVIITGKDLEERLMAREAELVSDILLGEEDDEEEDQG